MKARLFSVGVVFFLMYIIGMGFSEAQDQYVIGYQTDMTGPGSSNFAPQQEGFKLYMQTLNDRGGIKGRRVNVIYEDDKSSPPRAGSIATKFILEDKVLLIAGLSFSHSQPPVYELVKKHGVPLVVAFACVAAAFDPALDGSKQIFATGPVKHPNFNLHGYSSGLLASKYFPKGTTLAVMCYATPGGRLDNAFASWASKKYGNKVVFQEEIPPGTVDVSPWVEKIIKANPDVGILSFGGETTVPLWINLEKMGFTKPILNASFMSTEDFHKAEGAFMKPNPNLYLFSDNAMPFDVNPPAEYGEIEKAMKKYGHTYALSNRHAAGWLTARVIEQALGRVGWPATRSALIEALEKTDLDTRGLTGGHIRFSPTDHYGPAWAKLYRWDPSKKKLVTVVDWLEVNPREISKEYVSTK